MKLYPTLLDRLNSQHESIPIIISEISKERLLKNPLPGKWNIHDNIAHLAKYQPVFIDRVNKILNDDEPLFTRYKAEDDPEFEQWRSFSTDKLLKQLDTDRKKIYSLIINLNETELNKIGVHKKYGRLNIIQWTEFFLLHEAHHIFTIFQLANDAEL